MGKDLKDLEKGLGKIVKQGIELDGDLAKDLKKGVKKSVKDTGKTVEKYYKYYKKDNKKGENPEWLSWGVIVLLFLLGLSPIALILLLVKLFGRDGKKTAPADGGKTASGKSAGAVSGMIRTPAVKRSTALVLKILGAVIGVSGLFAAGNPLSMFFVSSDWWGLWFGDFLSALSVAAAGGAMFFSGVGMTRRLKRYAKYLAVMGDRESVEVEEFSRTLGIGYRRVERDLEKMVEQGFFGGKAYLHREMGVLTRGGHVERAAAQKPNPKPADTAETVESEYAAILRKIREANDLIEDEVLSAKIDRIETVTAGIFRVVEREPDKKARIQTFLNYYLPTTQKLLDSYAEFERAGVEGENLRQAKQRIEVTMDKIIEGFEHQLDELYRNEAMDVDSDIRVMETMLRRDTASVERDFGTAVQTQSKEK